MREAGFSRHGADWSLAQGDVTREAFLSVVRDPDGDICELSCSVHSTPNGEECTDENRLALFGCADLPPTNAPKGYGPRSGKSIDDFISDVRQVACPLMVTLDSTAAVIAAKIDGRLGPKFTPDFVCVVDGWRRAVKYDIPDEAERAVRILRGIQVDRRDKQLFAELIERAGVPL